MNRVLTKYTRSLGRFALTTLAVLAGLLVGAQTAAAETLVAVPLHCTGDIPTAIGRGFTEHLRGLAASRAEVVDPEATEQAMATANASVACATEACAVGIAGAAGARFVLSGTVDNTDEIYKVTLRLYDASTKTSRAAEGLCELCAAEEVDRTLGAAFAQLQPALVASAPPPAAARVAIEVVTNPPGADITLAGTPVGKAPIVLRVDPGDHVITATQDGMKPVERTVQARKETVKLSLRLQPATGAAPPVATPPAASPPPVTPPVVTPTVSGTDEDDGGYVYTGAGMLIGGALLTAGGITAIMFDGEITCTDGLGRRECPTVYNTKGVGITALSLGAGLIGAGVALIIVDVLDDGDVTPSAIVTPDGGAIMGLGGRF